MPDPVQAEIAEEQARNWRDETTETVVNMLLAERAAAMGRVERLRAVEESIARFAREQAGMTDQATHEAESEMISVGNKVTNYYQGQTAQEPKTGSTALKTAAMGLALLGGGAGVGAAVSQYFNTAPAAVGDSDTDTLSVIDFPE